MPINSWERIINGRKKKIIIEPFFPNNIDNNNQKPTQTIQPNSSVTAEKREQQQSPNKEKRSIKRPMISSFGLSISALTKADEQEAEVSTTKTEPNITESFTPLELLNEWKKYAESLTEEHHLKNTMLNCLPDLQSRDYFEVVVNNPVQEQRLVDNSLSILSELRTNLRNSNIYMKVRVSIENEKKLGFTSFEKFNLMVEQNEALKKLKDEFGLELM